MGFGDIIAIGALLLSAYAIWTTSAFNRRQLKVIESQEQLNALLLEQSKSDALHSKKGDVGVTLARLGNSKYRLKVWNRGKAAAKNVRLGFPDGNELVDDSDMAEVFPLETLQTQQSIELNVYAHLGLKSKHKVRVRWADEVSDDNSETFILTL